MKANTMKTMEPEDEKSYHSIVSDLKSKGYSQEEQFWVKPTGRRRFSFDKLGYEEQERFEGSWERRRGRLYAGRGSIPDDSGY